MAKKRVAALGFFDGVHIGHAALISRVVDVSCTTGYTPSVITFNTLPQNIISSENTPLINSSADKTGLIKRIFGIDDIICLPFDSAMAELSWDEFIDHLVIAHNVSHFVVGSNFKFGKGALGNSMFLSDKCKRSGLGCDIINAVKYSNIICSSTYIRELLQRGDIEQANAFLGHKHVLTGIVRGGQRLGRTLDAPTINMLFERGVLVPAFGVYATKVFIGENLFLSGVTNIGVRPTVAKTRRITAETFIFNFEETLYDSEVRLEFCKFIRPEQKFESVDELKEQIQKDCDVALEYFDTI
ncbi:MAG: bifunctional riboflavin kinase/FAD synthetase [Oscillospiraceae bacterium]|nr:bifunctional riboflavin kinase/FAD synthetase [Oscillospiraceae bacterium]